MPNKYLAVLLLTTLIMGCKSETKSLASESYSNVKMVSAMKHVMWKGELDGKIQLDTISDKVGLYGLGPESFLAGELLINNGKSYVSKVTSDSTMIVTETFDSSAPFFVYANVREWEMVALPPSVKNSSDIESFVDQKTKNFKRPFAFKLIGKVTKADIHIQNLPKGTKVSSPKEAHQGQTNYELRNETVEIIGFFSTEHQGIFTHHDSFLHMHLINSNATKMGHLDAVEIDDMTLYLPKK